MSNLLKKHWKEACIVLTSATLSALLLFVPSLSKLGGEENNVFTQIWETFFHTAEHEVLLGDGADPVGSFWIVGFVQDVLLGERDTIDERLYAPYGLDLGTHEGYAWLDTLFAMPLRWLVGSPGFYNLHVFCTLILSFLACHVLFRRIGASLWGAAFFAHLCVCNEFVYQEISYGRPTQTNWLFGALFVWASMSLIHHPKKWLYAFVGGVFFGGFCLTYWFGAAGLGFSMLFVLIYEHIRQKEYRAMIQNALLMLLGVVVTVLPITWRVVQPILQGKPNAAFSSLLDSPTKTYDVLGISFPVYSSEVMLTLNDLNIFVHGRHYPYALLIMYLLTTVLLLWKRKILWTLFITIALLLPVGSALTIKGVVTPSPYAFLEWIFPPLVRCNFPDRLMLAPLLLVFVAFVFHFHASLEQTCKKIGKALLPIVLVLLSLNLWKVWSSHTPQTKTFTVNTALQKIAKETPGGFIEFPFSNGNESYVQIEFHGQQILTGPGMMMIHPPASKRYLLRNRVLADMNKIEKEGFTPADKPTDIDLLELHKDGFRHVVIYTDELNKPVGMFERYFRQKGVAYPAFGMHVIPLPEPK